MTADMIFLNLISITNIIITFLSQDKINSQSNAASSCGVNMPTTATSSHLGDVTERRGVAATGRPG